MAAERRRASLVHVPVVALLGALAAGVAMQVDATPPNFLFVLADDTG